MAETDFFFRMTGQLLDQKSSKIVGICVILVSKKNGACHDVGIKVYRFLARKYFLNDRPPYPETEMVGMRRSCFAIRRYS